MSSTQGKGLLTYLELRAHFALTPVGVGRGTAATMMAVRGDRDASPETLKTCRPAAALAELHPQRKVAGCRIDDRRYAPL